MTTGSHRRTPSTRSPSPRRQRADGRATRAVWDAEFRATLTVSVGGRQLDVELGVENTGASDFSFTCALHTYLRVFDSAAAQVIGLHDFASQFAARDAVDEGATSNLRLELNLVNAPTSGYAIAAQETLFAAPVGA